MSLFSLTCFHIFFSLDLFLFLFHKTHPPSILSLYPNLGSLPHACLRHLETAWQWLTAVACGQSNHFKSLRQPGNSLTVDSLGVCMCGFLCIFCVFDEIWHTEIHQLTSIACVYCWVEKKYHLSTTSSHTHIHFVGGLLKYCLVWDVFLNKKQFFVVNSPPTDAYFQIWRYYLPRMCVS